MNWPRPPNESPRTAATVASPIVVTLASRTPAMISGTASGSSTRQSRSRRRVAHPLGRLEDVGGHGVEAGDDVADEDEQRVRRQRDDRGQQRQPEDRAEDRERGEARDRVEDAGDRGRPAPYVRGRRTAQIGEDQRDDEAQDERDDRQLEVLDDAPRDVVEVLEDPFEVDERLALLHRRVTRSRRPARSRPSTPRRPRRAHRCRRRRLGRRSRRSPGTAGACSPSRILRAIASTVSRPWTAPSRSTTMPVWTSASSIIDRASLSVVRLLTDRGDRVGHRLGQRRRSAGIVVVRDPAERPSRRRRRAGGSRSGSSARSSASARPRVLARPRPWSARARSTSATRSSDSRLSPRSAPTNRATNSEAGCGQDLGRRPELREDRRPSGRPPTRSPILMASSMSWVTNRIVLARSPGAAGTRSGVGRGRSGRPPRTARP